MPEPDRRHADHRRRDPLRPHPRQPTCPTSPRRSPPAASRLRETRVVPDDHGRDRRGGERAARPLHPRLHLRRHRPDPRRHHRRRGRRRLRRAASTCARTPAPSSRSNYANPEVDLNPARLRMARIPDGAALIENPVSQRARLLARQRARHGRRPAVFEAMVAGLLPRLTGGRPLLSETPARRPPRGRDRRAARPRRRGAPGRLDRQLPVHPAGRFGSNLVARSEDPDGARRRRRGAAGAWPPALRRGARRTHPRRRSARRDRPALALRAGPP